jgi:hypothetical protein
MPEVEVNPGTEKTYVAMRHENGPQAFPRLSLLQHAEWAAAAVASPHGNDLPLMLIVDTAKGISELQLLLLRPDRATHSSTTPDSKANA